MKMATSLRWCTVVCRCIIACEELVDEVAAMYGGGPTT